MAKIDFLPDNKIYESERGETILQTAASRNGIPHVAPHAEERVNVQPADY